MTTGALYALSSKVDCSPLIHQVALAVVGVTAKFYFSGDSFGFDFNPTIDRIRVVKYTGQNLRLHLI
jgi:hypothetical protein